MEIPYGRSNFEEIRRKGYFYVDKTPFIPLLESSQVGYPLFLRPRRFGKSTLLSMLEHYYDIGRKEQFDDLFKGLWIHDHPTAERSGYLVLSLDFSTVTTDGGPDVLRRTFFQSVRSRIRAFLLRHRDRVQPLAEIHDALGDFQEAEALLGEVMAVLSTTPYKLYVLIDEYDHFANRLLAGGSQDLYESIIKDTGFVRTFYATLKSGTASGAVGGMFVTGVSPLMLDDLSSGFNIITNVSQDPDLNTLAGFTRADVERAVEELLATRPDVAKTPELSDRAELFDVLERHYDGYRFSPGASERIFNSDMVLYFLNQVDRMREYPGDMLDPNVRTDYRHLQRIGTLGGAGAEERRELLTRILTEGHIRSDLARQFGVKSLSSHTPYISLLYYLGMLTLREAPRDAMAVNGDIAPFLDVFHSQVIKAFGVKDTRRLDEKTIKLLFMMYVSLGRAFHPLSEKEFAQGYCDLFLGASKNVANARFSWLLEFKYLGAGAKAAQIEAAFTEAAAQVTRYASDRELLSIVLENRELKAGMIVFIGTKKVLFRPWPPEPSVKRPRAKAKPARPRSAPSRSRKTA